MTHQKKQFEHDLTYFLNRMFLPTSTCVYIFLSWNPRQALWDTYLKSIDLMATAIFFTMERQWKGPNDKNNVPFLRIFEKFWG